MLAFWDLNGMITAILLIQFILNHSYTIQNHIFNWERRMHDVPSFHVLQANQHFFVVVTPLDYGHLHHLLNRAEDLCLQEDDCCPQDLEFCPWCFNDRKILSGRHYLRIQLLDDLKKKNTHWVGTSNIQTSACDYPLAPIDLLLHSSVSHWGVLFQGPQGLKCLLGFLLCHFTQRVI